MNIVKIHYMLKQPSMKKFNKRNGEFTSILSHKGRHGSVGAEENGDESIQTRRYL